MKATFLIVATVLAVATIAAGAPTAPITGALILRNDLIANGGPYSTTFKVMNVCTGSIYNYSEALGTVTYKSFGSGNPNCVGNPQVQINYAYSGDSQSSNTVYYPIGGPNHHWFLSQRFNDSTCLYPANSMSYDLNGACLYSQGNTYKNTILPDATIQLYTYPNENCQGTGTAVGSARPNDTCFTQYGSWYKYYFFGVVPGGGGGGGSGAGTGGGNGGASGDGSSAGINGAAGLVSPLALVYAVAAAAVAVFAARN